MLKIKKGTKKNGYKGLEYYANKSFLSRKDKEKQAELYREAQKVKERLIQDKGLKRTWAKHVADKNVDWNRTYGGDGEKAQILAQILDPDADWKKYKIRCRTRDRRSSWYRFRF